MQIKPKFKVNQDVWFFYNGDIRKGYIDTRTVTVKEFSVGEDTISIYYYVYDEVLKRQISFNNNEEDKLFLSYRECEKSRRLMYEQNYS